MIATLSPRERRLVAVAILLGLVALVRYALLGPLIGGFGDRAAERAALLETYARDAQATAQIPSVRRAAERQRADAARYLLVAPNATAAGDLLRDRVAAAVTAAGGTLRSIEDAAPAPARVAVRADARLTTAQLTALLLALDRAAPLLVVETLTVAADEAFATNRAGVMDVRFEVSARTPAPQPR